tara:strand:- start:234 stop:443 length:210 start_codon:yes stop_codon:yes gene_type:complete
MEFTEEELLALNAKYVSAADLKKEEAINSRKNEYPSIEDQLDMQYWDSVNGTTTWKDAIAKVKTDNPKS